MASGIREDAVGPGQGRGHIVADSTRPRAGHVAGAPSQITFSALGQLAPIEEKRRWDPDDTKKRRLVAAVAGDLGHLRVRAGGYTSVDVSAGNTDKAFALRELAGRLGIGTGDIIFVGDRMTPGGNDYPAAQAGAIALQVTGPQDTVRLCDILLPLLGGEPVRQDG